MYSLIEAKAIKPHLKFDIGDVVFLKSDTKKTCPMTITGFIIMDDDNDYVLSWMNSQKVQEKSFFPDRALTNEK
jgi:uncharacterized protein YodC (DUF2158 family)